MTEKVRWVEQHIIKKTDPRFAAIDEAAFASGDLYNAATYIVRQSFIHDGKYITTLPSTISSSTRMNKIGHDWVPLLTRLCRARGPIGS